MSLAIVRGALLWCAIINFGMLFLWFVLLASPHEWLNRIWGRWVRLTPEQFDAVNYAGLLVYKMLILLFNVVPYIALWIVG